MKRKHFETTGQTVITKVISIKLKKGKKKYDYLIVKLPATFKDQVVKLWNPRTNFGIKKIAISHGGSGLIRLNEDDNEKNNFQLGDVLTATFSNKEAILD